MGNRKFDPLEFVLHFVFGAIIGFILSGVVVFWFADAFGSSAGWIVGVTSLVIGLLGGVFGDQFWKALRENPIFRLWAELFAGWRK